MIQHIHTYLVHPGKLSEDSREISGTTVPPGGQLFELLKNIYQRSHEECNIDITFSPAADGTQQNDCRDLIREYLGDTTLEKGKKIAARLERNTDRRSGLGLLFLMVGNDGEKRRVVISRFPTDVAVYVEEDRAAFSVEFLERVFMKNRASYKAAAYADASLEAGFWRGSAADKQLNGSAREVSNYWIADFLASQITVTAAAGTRRLAVAMRDAAQKADTGVKQEIIAAATLAKGLEGATLSIDDFGERYRLSQETKDAISDELRSGRLAEEVFEFDLREFERVNAYKSIELSNGGILTARSSDFGDVFRREPRDETEEGQVRFVTEGRIVDERLRAKA